MKKIIIPRIIICTLITSNTLVGMLLPLQFFKNRTHTRKWLQCNKKHPNRVIFKSLEKETNIPSAKTTSPQMHIPISEKKLPQYTGNEFMNHDFGDKCPILGHYGSDGFIHYEFGDTCPILGHYGSKDE